MKATRIAKMLILTLAAASADTAVTAQDLGRKAPPQQRGVVITGATVHPVSAPPIENGAIWFEAGVIRAIGAADAVQPSGDPEVIDATGHHVYPGLISAVTTLGLNEIGSVRATQDSDEVGELTPEVRAAVAVNPDSTVIPVTRSNGVLAAGVFPGGDLIPGRASVIRLSGWTWEDMTISETAGLVVDWPSAQPRRSRDPEAARRVADAAGERRQQIEAAFEQARAHAAARAADPQIGADIRLEALVPAARGEQTVFIRADAIEQIETAVSWVRRAGLRAVLVGGRDADLCTELLLRNEIPVIVTGTHRMPRRRDSDHDEAFRLPALLHQAGVRWCLATRGRYYNERNLPYHAATAVAYGLPREVALRSITLSAAELLGVDDRIGSLEVGKAATLIVTDGDPLHIATAVQQAFVDGRAISLTNKQTELYDKYVEKYRQLGLWPDK